MPIGIDAKQMGKDLKRFCENRRSMDRHIEAWIKLCEGIKREVGKEKIIEGY